MNFFSLNNLMGNSSPCLKFSLFLPRLCQLKAMPPKSSTSSETPVYTHWLIKVCFPLSISLSVRSLLFRSPHLLLPLLVQAEPDSRIEKGVDVKFSIDDFEKCKVSFHPLLSTLNNNQQFNHNDFNSVRSLLGKESGKACDSFDPLDDESSTKITRRSYV